MLIQGFVRHIRDHSRILFIDLLSFNSIDTMYSLVVKDSLLPTGRTITQDSYLSVRARRQEGYPTYSVEEFVEINLSTLGTKARDHERFHNLTPYRYLTLRSPEYRKIVDINCRMKVLVRRLLERRDFREFVTPILTRPSHEGARNYLVPSRLHAGSFYALAQSPQIYKQFLIYSGFNYYQFAPCFRDEDNRADRVNGEYYQLDLECQTRTLSKLINLQKSIVYLAAKEFQLSAIFYPNIKYRHAVQRFKTDKPWVGIDDWPSRKFFTCFEPSVGRRMRYNRENIAGKSFHLHVTFVTDMPMFEHDSRGILTYFANPFGDFNWGKTVESSVSRQFDMVINGIEITSGGLRNIDPEKLSKVFLMLGIDCKPYENFLSALRSGVPQHGGFGLGWERLIALLSSLLLQESVSPNDTLPFPLNDKKRELIMYAPGEYGVVN